MTAALSIAPYALDLLDGPEQEGIGLGHGYVAVGEDDVVALTPPGAPRMPNGIECELRVEAGERVRIGGGELRARAGSVTAGPVWDARPRRRRHVRVVPFPTLDAAALLGWGAGLTPLGDDVLLGRLAIGGDGPATFEATTRLSRVLLRRAALGELPEPAHTLLEDGDPRPLLGFGSTSGRGILLGLAERGPAGRNSFELVLPLPDGPARFEVSLC